MQPIDRLGAFYLGKPIDPGSGQRSAEPLMYDARDLTTHAVCVGMTGSGKTGLCIGLLEEAALDGVPALIIDPKGDITNLLLTFPELRPEDFAPWINADDARRKGLDPQAFAAKTAADWRAGLADWDQDPQRIARLKAGADFRIYTPGSDAGTGVSILASLRAPRGGWVGREEEHREQIGGVVGALLGLAGIQADPLRSPEHILLATIFEHFWSQGLDLDLASLITAIQNPPVRQLGVLDVDTFFPAKDRFGLAMALNGILASPGFAAWLQGDPLDIGAMLHAPDGRPRHAIFSIAHLDDAQRMFFVTLLLEQTLAWVRRQSGTTSLRALLYMDEIFGFLPPTANPPSKRPLLTLLKQARAFGLGVMLTTQNPVDLDYKALSNAGTWFIGKLQTEQDKARVLDGLQSAAGGIDRRALGELIGGLGQRVFLLHNVHEGPPALFQTRWVMSYLRGPLTRDQIRSLKSAPEPVGAARGPASPAPVAAPAAAVAPPGPVTAGPPDGLAASAPPVPPAVPQVWLPARQSRQAALAAAESASGRRLAETDVRLAYRPRLLALARVGFVDRRRDIQAERPFGVMLEGESLGAVLRWDDGSPVTVDASSLEPAPAEGAFFAQVPSRLAEAAFYRSATKDLRDHLYQTQEILVRHIPDLKLYGEPDEPEGEFLGRARQAARELRDAEVDKLRDKMEKAAARLQKKLDREEMELAEDKAEYDSRKQQELLSAGETLLGMFGVLGRKRSTGFSTAARKRRMTARAKEDIAESQAEIAALTAEIRELQRGFQEEAEDIAARWEDVVAEPETFAVKPRRTDVDVQLVALAWFPSWLVGEGFELEAWA